MKLINTVALGLMALALGACAGEENDTKKIPETLKSEVRDANRIELEGNLQINGKIVGEKGDSYSLLGVAPKDGQIKQVFYKGKRASVGGGIYSSFILGSDGKTLQSAGFEAPSKSLSGLKATYDGYYVQVISDEPNAYIHGDFSYTVDFAKKTQKGKVSNTDIATYDNNKDLKKRIKDEFDSAGVSYKFKMHLQGPALTSGSNVIRGVAVKEVDGVKKKDLDAAIAKAKRGETTNEDGITSATYTARIYGNKAQEVIVTFDGTNQALMFGTSGKK